VKGLEVEVKVRGVAVAARRMGDLGTRAANPKPAFREIMRELQAQEEQWFASHGGGRWPPLAEVTIERKASRRPLVRTGALRKSLTQSGGANAIREIRQHELLFGSSLFYARIHQTGTPTMPRRNPMAPITDAMRDRAAQEVGAYIVGTERE
jgi:phage gpG-like protein